MTFVFFIPEKSHGGDMGHWERWAGFIKMEGFPFIYDYGTIYSTIFPCNYPPIVLYFLKIFSLCFSDMEQITEHMKYFKIIPLLFDFISAALIFLLIKRDRKTSWLPLLLLLSPAFLYNSYCWGQVDGILTAFIAIALILAVRQKWMLAIIFYIIAINTKMQAIVFLPVFALAIFPSILSWKKLGTALLLALSTQVLILAPFILFGTVDTWYQVMGSLVDQYQNVSLNAFNFWYLLLDGNGPLYTKDYQELWFGIDHKTWGLLFFFVFSFFALWPMLLKSIRYAFQKITPDSSFKELVFLSAFLCILGFFFFNTQMHERYSHPAMLMAFLYGILNKNYWIYGITSIAYFLNMERTLRYFEISYHTFIFEHRFIAALFLVAILIGLWQLYKKHSISQDWTFICKLIKRV